MFCEVQDKKTEQSFKINSVNAEWCNIQSCVNCQSLRMIDKKTCLKIDHIFPWSPNCDRCWPPTDQSYIDHMFGQGRSETFSNGRARNGTYKIISNLCSSTRVFGTFLPELFKILKSQKKFMLKLQHNSDIWQIYCISQPKNLNLWVKDKSGLSTPQSLVGYAALKSNFIVYFYKNEAENLSAIFTLTNVMCYLDFEKVIDTMHRKTDQTSYSLNL
ncbi:hypothetical protein BpHYR1_019973 [Brachionus plicatilis]|uniref:Uncharacterized protein n=1 Tax=Brachionus plicatilis TaxID=10195 RepID=A0A3M7PQE3_BRAPC|nr:hypothetical protein BpHYR1_019973 [Brachionus plicatilis]